MDKSSFLLWVEFFSAALFSFMIAYSSYRIGVMKGMDRAKRIIESVKKEAT